MSVAFDPTAPQQPQEPNKVDVSMTEAQAELLSLAQGIDNDVTQAAVRKAKEMAANLQNLMVRYRELSQICESQNAEITALRTKNEALEAEVETLKQNNTVANQWVNEVVPLNGGKAAKEKVAT